MKYSQRPRSKTWNVVGSGGGQGGVIMGVRGYSPPGNFVIKTPVP